MKCDFRYRLRAQELSRIFRDERQTPVEKAVSSIEYIIRHKGAPFLRSPAAGMPDYQVLLLDVIPAIVLCVTLPILIIFWILKKVICCVKRLTHKTDVKKKLN